MTLAGKPRGEVLVDVRIREYPGNQRDQIGAKIPVTLAGEFASVGGVRFKLADFQEALRVLGYQTGPVYRNAQDALDAAGMLLPLGTPRGQ